jgi:hypothetical protein
MPLGSGDPDKLGILVELEMRKALVESKIQVAHEDYEREATHVALEFRQKILALTLNVFVEEFVFSSPIFETARSCCLAR